MEKQASSFSFGGFLRRAIERGLKTAYEQVGVDSKLFLVELRVEYGLDLGNYSDLFGTRIERLDEIADDIIRGAQKLAATSGAGFGIGGISTIAPDMAVLGVITMRTIQKLSLLYGFEFNTESEQAEFLIAFVSAIGVNAGREQFEKLVLNRAVPNLLRAAATKMGSDLLRRAATKIIPVISSAVGGAVNYYFVGLWGARAKGYFREKHLARRVPSGDRQTSEKAAMK